MIQKAAALAETRGWDFDVLSPLQLALAIPSYRWRHCYNAYLHCSIDGCAWGFVIHKEFEVMGSREPEVSLAIQRLRQFCTPDEIDILPSPQYLIRYTRDIDVEINGKFETQLGVVSRKLWKFPGGVVRAREGSMFQAARSRGMGSRG